MSARGRAERAADLVGGAGRGVDDSGTRDGRQGCHGEAVAQNAGKTEMTGVRAIRTRARGDVPMRAMGATVTCGGDRRSGCGTSGSARVEMDRYLRDADRWGACGEVSINRTKSG